MNKCLSCQKSLVPVGNERANGKRHDDWKTRQYHKKCFKELTWKRTYFNIPYSQRDIAKPLGAKWDDLQRSWFAPNNAIKINLLIKGFEEDENKVYKCVTQQEDFLSKLERRLMKH